MRFCLPLLSLTLLATSCSEEGQTGTPLDVPTADATPDAIADATAAPDTPETEPPDAAESPQDVAIGDASPETDAPALTDTTPDVPDAADMAPCDQAKLGPLSQENPQKFEFYEVCIPEGSDKAVEAALKAIDDTLYCGVLGVFAGCEAGEAGCHGDLSYAPPGSKVLSDGKWEQLCKLSQLERVMRMGGGHFVN
jgi:hypothetical protein